MKHKERLAKHSKSKTPGCSASLFYCASKCILRQKMGFSLSESLFETLTDGGDKAR